MRKESARPPVINPRNMSELIVFLLALDAYGEVMGEEDAHFIEGTRLSRRYRNLIDDGFEIYFEPMVEGYDRFKRFRAPFALTKSGDPERQASLKARFLKALLPVLRVQRPVLEEAFAERRAVDVAVKAALAVSGDDPKVVLRELSLIPTAAKIQTTRGWIKKAALLAGAEPEMAEGVVSDAATTLQIGEELRQVNAALAQVDPMTEEGAALQAEKQEILDRIDDVAASSESPETVFTTAATQAAAEPRIYQTKTGADRKLNPDKEAAMMIRGKGIIAAGAGAGKTMTLASKVVYHINELGVPAEGVVATSFSRKSAAELRRRIGKYGGVIEDRQATGFGTTHSVAAKLMRQYERGGREGIKPYNQDKLIRLAMKQVEMGNGSIPVPPATSMFAGLTGRPAGVSEAVEEVEEAPVELTFNEAMNLAYERRNRLNYFLQGFIDGFFNRGSQWYRMNMRKTNNLREPGTLTSKQKDILRDIFRKTGVDYPPPGKRLAAKKRDADKGLREKYDSFSRPVNQWFNLGLELVRGEGDSAKPIPVGEFKGTISRLKGKLVSPTEAWHNGDVEESHAAVYAAYEYLKSPNGEPDFAGKGDFDDVLIDVSKMMLRNPQARNQIQSRFKVILVDEAQDLNRAQHVMFGLMAGYLDPAKLDQVGQVEKISELARDDGKMTADTYCFIGDDKQAIYEFRGADPEAFIDMSDLVEGGAGFTTHVLETNYRSGKNIVEAANRLIAFNSKQIPMVCKANPERMDEGGVKTISFPPAPPRDSSAPAAWVAEHIAEQMELGLESGGEGSMSYDSFGLGLRTNAEAMAYGVEMIKKGIPFRSKINFFRDPATKALLGWLTIADEGLDGNVDAINDAVIKVVNTPVNMLGKKFVETLTERATGNYIEWLDDNGESIYGRSKWSSYVRNFTDNLLKIADLKGQDLSSEQVLGEVLNLQGYDGTGIKDSLIDKLRGDEERMAALIAAAPDGRVDEDELVEEALAPIAPLKGLLDARGDLTESMKYVRKLESANQKLAKDDDPNKGPVEPAVTLGTMHSWKGLEVPTMYIPMVGGSFPRFDKTSEEDLASERRLAYVAVTRAEDNAYILDIPTARETKEGIVTQTSRFVGELCAPELDSEGKVASLTQEELDAMDEAEMEALSDELDAEIDAYLAEQEAPKRALMASWGDLLYTKQG